MSDIEGLARLLAKNMPAETILVTPTAGEGRGLLKMAASYGLLVGVRTATPRQLALEICAEQLAGEKAPRLMTAAETEDLLFSVLRTMPKTGFLLKPHADGRKTAELARELFAELDAYEAPALGGNPRQEALESLRQAYRAAKGSELWDEGDLFRTASARAGAYFALRGTRFAALSNALLRPAERRLLEAAAGERLELLPMALPEGIAIPQTCLSPLETRSRDTCVLAFSGCRGADTEVRHILRHILEHNRPLEDCAVLWFGGEYSALLREEAALLGIPLSGAVGAPLAESKPYQILSLLNTWKDSAYSAEALRSIVHSGALCPEDPNRFAARIRKLNIGWGEERWTRRFLVPEADEEPLPEDWSVLVTVLLLAAKKQGTLQEQKETLSRVLSFCCPKNNREGAALSATRRLLNGLSWLEPEETVLSRLLALLERGSLSGQAENPNTLLCTSLQEGSLRKYLYICGMSRFCLQGSRAESPLLLDEEKRRCGLPTLQDREAEGLFRLRSLLLHHTGEARLSYCDYDTERMIPLSPSPVFTLLSEGRPMEKVSYLPRELLLPGDRAVCGLAVENSAECRLPPDAEQSYLEALDAFAYSPSALETAMSCPLKFYLNKFLGLYPDDLPDRSTDSWLAANELGTLCHGVLERYYRQEGTIDSLLQEEAAKLQQSRPDSTPATMGKELSRARTLVERAVSWTERSGHTVAATEKHFGKNAGETPIPLQIGSRTLSLSGSIDRLDLLPNGTAAILDYKTGNGKDYREHPFHKLQPYLYALAAEQLNPGLKVTESGYLFLREGADYFAVSQSEEARAEKQAAVLALLDWLRDEERARIAAPAFRLSPDGITLRAGSAKERTDCFDECSKWCDFVAICPAKRQIAEVQRAEETAAAAEREELDADA